MVILFQLIGLEKLLDKYNIKYIVLGPYEYGYSIPDYDEIIKGVINAEC